jgi:hypothetical protein
MNYSIDRAVRCVYIDIIILYIIYTIWGMLVALISAFSITWDRKISETCTLKFTLKGEELMKIGTLVVTCLMAGTGYWRGSVVEYKCVIREKN